MGKGARNRRVRAEASALAGGGSKQSWRTFARAIRKGRLPHVKSANQR